MKYFILFFCFLLTQANARAQYYLTHREDTVRWFAGKWIDKNTFKIDSSLSGTGGSGGTITRSADGGLRMNADGEKAFEDKVMARMQEIDKVEKEIAQNNKENDGINQIRLVQESIKELEKVKADLKEISENKLNNIRPENGQTGSLANSCARLAPQYHHVIDFYLAHKNETHFDLPAPPAADYFNCWSCDTAKQMEFDTLSAQYVRNFYKEESAAITFLLSIIQQMDAFSLGISSGNDQDGHEKEAFHLATAPGGPCAFINYHEMTKALEFYFQRGVLMAKQLWEDNKTNYGALNSVLRICLSTYQQSCATEVAGMNFGVLPGLMADMAKPLEKLYDSMTTLMIKKKDYRLIGNISFMLGLYLNILGLTNSYTLNGSEVRGDSYSPRYGMEDLFAFPHFELSIDLDVKTGANGSYTITHLKSTSKVLAQIDAKNCVKFILAAKENGKITANILTNEAISPQPHGTYVGTKIYTSQSPVFSIHFCPMEGVPEGDSIYLSTFVPLAPDKGNWNIQGRMAPLAINQADRLFINIDELKNDAQNYSQQIDQKKLEDLQKNALDMAEKLKQMQAAGNGDPMKMAEMVQKMTANAGAVVETDVARMMRIRLPLKVSNLDKVLVNQRFDAKEINPATADAIVYAYLTVKLVNTPLGRGELD